MDKRMRINYSKVFDTVKNLKTLEDVFNRVDFHVHFDGMEDYFRELNFEHDSCLEYKDKLDIINRDLDTIRTNINDLNQSLSKASVSIIDKEQLTSGKLDMINKMYQSSDIMKKIRAEMSNEPVGEGATPLSMDTGEIDTVPIGIAIGATGIAGSIGAIVLDSLKDKKNGRESIDRFEQQEVETYDDTYYDTPIMNDTEGSLEDDDNTYKAVKDKGKAFDDYSNTTNIKSDLEKYKPSYTEIEPSKDIDLTLEEDDDDDDFDE